MKKLKEINNVCSPCGLAANTLTCLVKYGKLPEKPSLSVSTFHIANCDCCGRRTHVTEARDFFYPDFSLLSTRFTNRLEERRLEL